MSLAHSGRPHHCATQHTPIHSPPHHSLHLTHARTRLTRTRVQPNRELMLHTHCCRVASDALSAAALLHHQFASSISVTHSLMLSAAVTVRSEQKSQRRRRNDSARTGVDQRGGAPEADASSMQHSQSIAAQFWPMFSMLWSMLIHGRSFKSVRAVYALEVFLTWDG